MPDTPTSNDIELTVRGRRIEVGDVRLEYGMDGRMILALSVPAEEVMPVSELSEVFDA